MFLDDLPISSLKDKVIFLRVDLNVPIKITESVENSFSVSVVDDTRIRKVIPTITYLRKHNAKAICLCSHLGRPKGKIDPRLSLFPLCEILSELTQSNVQYVKTCIGEELQNAIDASTNGTIILMENIRFYSEEEDNDPEFSKCLAKPFQIFVNDAFAACHRSHSSIEGITHFIDIAVGGFLLKDEVTHLAAIMQNPCRPFTALIGGAKISTKLQVLYNLLDHVDKLLIGGGMVFTFYRALGLDIGKSICEENLVPTAACIIEKAKKKNVELILAPDVVVADFDSECLKNIQTVPMNEIPSECVGLDIGNQTIESFFKELEKSKTILWNGPLGAIENDYFKKGTNAVIDFLAALTLNGVTTVVCGGDTVGATENSGLASFSFISTGGGATLQFLAGGKMPGLEALEST